MKSKPPLRATSAASTAPVKSGILQRGRPVECLAVAVDVGPGEVGVLRADPGEARPDGERPAEHGPGQGRPGEADAAHVRLDKVRARQVRGAASERRCRMVAVRAEARAPERGSASIHAVQAGPREVR